MVRVRRGGSDRVRRPSGSSSIAASCIAAIRRWVPRPDIRQWATLIVAEQFETAQLKSSDDCDSIFHEVPRPL
jgi:hypothetical protein